MAIIGERPSLADGLGFLLITTAVFVNTRPDKNVPSAPVKR
jgi:hypothetical protein